MIADAFSARDRDDCSPRSTPSPTTSRSWRGYRGTAHGDACPRNLLRTTVAPEGFVVIDFGSLCEAPLGFDLSQVLLGEVQLGERPADELVDLDRSCLLAWVEGLRDEGCDVPLPLIRRAHALVMLVFYGLSAPPIEVMFGGPALEVPT